MRCRPECKLRKESMTARTEILRIVCARALQRTPATYEIIYYLALASQAAEANTAAVDVGAATTPASSPPLAHSFGNVSQYTCRPTCSNNPPIACEGALPMQTTAMRRIVSAAAAAVAACVCIFRR